MNQNLGLHEGLEMHELLTFKCLCLTKSMLMQGFVTDQTLTEIMQDDVKMSTKHVEDLRNHLQQ